jgi:hypothetical protein
LVDCLEVAGECWAWFDGDDRAIVLPDVVEQAGQEPASLGWVGLGVPEASEVLGHGRGRGRLVAARRSGRGYVSEMLSPEERTNSQIVFRHFFPSITQKRIDKDAPFIFTLTQYAFQIGQYT